MGLLLEDLGTHSFRKGLASFLASQPSGPSPINIWHRAGWSLGPVQSRYIFQGPGGDQFIGRAATLLDLNDVSFGILPPHFNDREGPVLTTAEWEIILPGYSTFYPRQFRVALPYLLASLVHHKAWLEQNLPSNHPIFLQRVWREGYIERLQGKVHLGVMRNKTTGMVATGIPPSVVILDKISQIFQSMENSAQNVRDQINRLPSELRREIMDRFELVDGVRPLTHDDLAQMEERILNRLSQLNAPQISQEAPEEVAPNPLRTWTWGGQFHPVPEDFILPKTTTKVFWDL